MYVKPFAQAAFAAVSLLSAALSQAEGLRDYRAVALSGDGERIAAIETPAAAGGQRQHAAIVVRDGANGRILWSADPCGACSYDRPSWSPDGKAVAFIGSDSKAGSATLYVAEQGKARQVAQVKGVASTARWSPDGKTLALLATPGAKKETGATAAGARLIGEIGSEEDAQRIASVPAAGGELKLLSPGDTFVYEYDWTPDGKGFVASSAKGNGDNNWWVAKLTYVDAATGALRIIASPNTQMNMPRVSPDGKTVAFIGGLMSDFGAIGGDLYTVPLAGGEPKNITPGFKGTFNGLAWKRKGIVGTALMGDQQTALAVDAVSGKTEKLWSAAVSSSGSDGRLSFSADGSMAAGTVEDYEHASHILAGRLPQLKQITHDNDAASSQVSVRNIAWTNEGFNVQGWLLGPQKTEQGKTYPMIVRVHGGPASAVTPRFIGSDGAGDPLVHALVQKGYFVFLPNPRGSFGQGQDFARANRRDFGGGDLRDIQTGIDAVLKTVPVDGERLGVMGHSYGGFMTMWTVTHTKRFKAAVAGAGIANWISYYGQNGIDQWMIPFFGASAYDDPAIYRKLSPIETIKDAKTPTFIYVGERDVECPPAQSMEFWHGLRAMDVPTSLVIYQDEGHSIRKPDHQRDLRERTLAWFDKYLAK